jgi:hypothetical protein
MVVLYDKNIKQIKFQQNALYNITHVGLFLSFLQVRSSIIL